MKAYLLILGMLAWTCVCSAQKAEQTSIITGKPILTLFANYKAGLDKGNNISGFNLDRTFVGYEGLFPKGFSAKVIMNVETINDDSGHTAFNAYLKNAQMDWKGHGFFISAGLVNLKQFSEQENFWGHRYIHKSFQEEYGITFCEDIGVIAGYEFSPVISVDAALTNGEGRKLKNIDNKYKYGAGTTIKPVKGLIIRLYGDIHNIPEHLVDSSIVQKDQYSVAAFIGYSHKHFSIGAEYIRAFNYKFNSHLDINGYSLYTTVKITPQMHIYARFDYLNPAGKNGTRTNNEHTVICGFEYSPIKQIRISPNYQNRKTPDGRHENYLLISLECKI